MEGKRVRLKGYEIMLNYHRHGNIHVDTNKTEKGDEKNVKRLHEHERKRQRERRRN